MSNENSEQGICSEGEVQPPIMKKPEDASGSDEEWDEMKLINAYKKAIHLSAIEVAQRLAMSTNTKSKNTTALNSRNSINPGKSSKVDSKILWRPGMACRAVYNGDNLEYEAIILRIINSDMCVVKFLGYNSDRVATNALKPSLGREQQAKQIEASPEMLRAGSDMPAMETLACESRAICMSSSENTYDGKNRKRKWTDSVNLFGLPNMPSIPNIPLMQNLGSETMPNPVPLGALPFTPPPPPPLDSEDETISSMLLSWYMSGYYSGLLQGMKRAKEN